MAGTTPAGMVARELEKHREKRFTGSVWRIGRHALTTVDGRLTDIGHAFRRLRPAEDLSHYDRSTERITGTQVRARDPLGYERVVARMRDGKTLAPKTGQSYYDPGSSVFTACVPAWRRDAQGNLFQTSVPVDDHWLRLAAGGDAALAELRSGVYSEDPKAVHRRIVEALVRATREKATLRQSVLRQSDPFEDGDGRERHGSGRPVR
jgi:hypothetical protein